MDGVCFTMRTYVVSAGRQRLRCHAPGASYALPTRDETGVQVGGGPRAAGRGSPRAAVERISDFRFQIAICNLKSKRNQHHEITCVMPVKAFPRLLVPWNPTVDAENTQRWGTRGSSSAAGQQKASDQRLTTSDYISIPT